MASLTTASSSSPTLTSIRERTRNAIAHHRAWRQPVLAAPDVRRTYAGTSASVAAGARHPPGPLQSSSSVAPSNPTTSSSASPCSVSLAPLNLRKNSSQEGSTGSNPRSQSCQTPSPEEAVYRAIEAEEQQERQQSRAIPQRQSYPQHYDHERSQQEYQQFSNDSSMNDISMENHLQQLEQQFGVSVRSSFESSAERTPATATPAPRKVDNKTQGSNDTGNESFRPRTMESTQMPLSNVVANPLVMDFRDPPQTLTKQQHYEQKLRDHAAKVKQQQQQQNHGLIYRDDGSVMTGMSQQELIRKKTRDTMRRSGSSSKRKNNSGSGKRSRNIVQLPANLLSLQPSVRISSPQKRHPQHQYYMAHSSVDGNQTDEEEKKIASRLASLRWNSNSRTSSARSGELPSNHSPNNNSNEEELDSFSTTAETTNASGESTPSPTTNARGLYSNNESYGPIDTSVTSESASRWMMGTSATTMPSGVVASSSRTVEWHPPNSQEDAWLDEEVNPGNHSTINNLSNEEPVYPTLSRNFEHAEIQRDEDCEESSEVNRINDRASDGDNIEMESSGFKSARRGVRFAETFDQNYSSTVSGGDEWSEVPWDQKNDQMGTQRSPASVLEAIAEPMGNERESEHDTCANLRPKSILRRSRFKPNSTTASRHLVNDFHFSDYESEHLIHGGNPMDKQRQTFVASRGMVAVKQTENARYEQTDQDKPRNAPSLRKARLAKSRDVNSSLDMSPPRHNALITDKEGLELSPIAQSSISEVSSSQQKQMNLNSNVPGHPAEKHLRGKLAAVREMRGGEIAEQVMEEVQYPDPPLEIDMDDDETVMSAYAFIETVAAIVVQTAARQFLAFLKVESLRFTRESKILESRILSIERAASEQADRASQGECEVVRRIGIREPLVYDQYQMKNILNDTSISNDFRVIEASEISECDIDDMAMNLYHLAAVQIQAVYRGFWIRDCLDVDHYCTTVLQRTYRGFKCRKMVQRDVKNIILVQSWWRRNIARDDAANILAYVIVLQAVYRGHRVRKRYKIHEEKVANYKAKWAAATIIQWIWRGYNVRKLYENYRDGESTMERAAATAIQSRWRAFVCEAYFIRTLVDVLIVQTVVRRWLAHGTTTARRQLQASTLVFDDVEKAGNMPSRRQNKEPLLVNDKESVAIHENTYSKPVDVPTIPQRLSTIQKQCSKIESYHSPRAQVNDQNQTGEDASHLVHNKSHSSAAPTNRQKEGTASAMGEVRARGLLSSVADPPGHVVKRSRFVSDYEMEPCRQVLRVNEMKASKAVAYPMNDDLDDLSRSLVVDVDTIRLIGASSKLNDVNQKDEQSKQHTKENLSMGVQSTSPQTRYFESDSMSASQSDAPSVGTTSNLLSIWKEKEKRNVIIEKSTVEHCLR